jgi:hypothetical protein
LSFSSHASSVVGRSRSPARRSSECSARAPSSSANRAPRWSPTAPSPSPDRAPSQGVKGASPIGVPLFSRRKSPISQGLSAMLTTRPSTTNHLVVMDSLAGRPDPHDERCRRRNRIHRLEVTDSGELSDGEGSAARQVLRRPSGTRAASAKRGPDSDRIPERWANHPPRLSPSGCRVAPDSLRRSEHRRRLVNSDTRMCIANKRHPGWQGRNGSRPHPPVHPRQMGRCRPSSSGVPLTLLSWSRRVQLRVVARSDRAALQVHERISPGAADRQGDADHAGGPALSSAGGWEL